MNIKIHEPWWSAYRTFGWAKGVWGVGLNAKMVDQAIENKERLKIQIYKHPERYDISPTTVKNYAENHGTKYLARGNVMLYVVPQTKLRKEGDNNG